MTRHSSKYLNAEQLPIALRCYADGGAFPLAERKNRLNQASRWTLIFDTETRTDAAQNIRFGTYQIRERDLLHEAGYSTTTRT
jgi:hypothetical protein